MAESDSCETRRMSNDLIETPDRELDEHAHAASQPSAKAQRWLVLAVGTATIFGAAFLLFSLQPLVGKIVLPRFGGSAAVWSVCLVFFQTALLAGYGIAYGLARLRPKQQIIGYALLWLVAALVAAVPVGDVWRLTWFENPAGELLLKLLRFVSLPYILVSSVSILVQVWARLVGVKDPYAFYAVSNVGSLGALLAYPTLIEPNLSVPASAEAWTWGFRFVALLVAGLSFTVWMARPQDVRQTEAAAESPPPGWERTLAWMFLSAVGSGLLVSFTSRMTQDIAPIPMLWIIPLSLYLLTFIICFAGMYRRDWILPLALIAFGVHTFLTLHYLWPDLGFSRELFGQTIEVSGVTVGIALASATFFLLVMLLHGELYALRPAPRYLSRYYVAIAAGGAIGGAFVSLGAPLVFKVQLEYPLLLGLALAVLLVVSHVHRVRLLQNHWLNLAVTLTAIVIGLWHTVSKMVGPQALGGADLKIFYYRNFYGPMRVEAAPDRKTFLHGTTTHGTQLTEGNAALKATTYYSDQSAVGVVYKFLTEDEKRTQLRIGAIGLGVGTLAAYARGVPYTDAAPGERSVIFYELDPDVAEIARTHFTYLTLGNPSVPAIHFGDARTTLEQQPHQAFDMLVVDAFTGDGIPVHLLTREALELYLRHVKPEGVILFHISNRYLRLETVLGNAAHALGLNALTVDHNPKGEDMDTSTYIVVSRRELPLMTQKWEDGGETVIGTTIRDSGLRLWTDDYSNLFSVLEEP
jgi:SAM-dependent methyltransferase